MTDLKKDTEEFEFYLAFVKSKHPVEGTMEKHGWDSRFLPQVFWRPFRKNHNIKDHLEKLKKELPRNTTCELIPIKQYDQKYTITTGEENETRQIWDF